MLQSKLPHASPAASLALALIDSSFSPVLLLDDKFGIVGASRSFCSAFGFEPDELEGKGISLAELGAGEWDVPQLRSLLKATFAGTAAVDAYEMDLRRRTTMRLASCSTRTRSITTATRRWSC